MSAHDDLGTLAGEFAREATGLLALHDVEEHDGERCELERANVVALLAHRIGFGVSTFNKAVAVWVEYERACPDRRRPTPKALGDPCDEEHDLAR